MRHLAACYGWSTRDHQASHTGKAGNHLDANVPAERPAQYDGLGYTEHSEHFDDGLRERRSLVTSYRIRRIAGLTVPRQVEGDQAVAFRQASSELMAKNVAAERVAVNEQHRETALAVLHHRNGAV